MGHTYTSLLYHVVFSTQQRRPLIEPAYVDRLAKFVGGVIRQRKGKLLKMNGPQDHLHLVAMFSPAVAVSDEVRDIKSLSSGWIHDTFSGAQTFAWQEGYSAFSVGKSNLDRVLRYVQNQQKHHRRLSFEEELVGMLDRAGIEYDPRYLWT